MIRQNIFSIKQLVRLVLTYLIPQLLFTNIHKHIHFNTITYKQKGKRVEPQILRLIYATPLIAVT